MKTDTKSTTKPTAKMPQNKTSRPARTKAARTSGNAAIFQGDMWEHICDAASRKMMIDVLAANHTHTPEALELLGELAEELAGHSSTGTATAAMNKFFHCSEEWADTCNRKAAFRTLEILCGAKGDASQSPTPPSAAARRRPFVALEAGVVRVCALQNPRSGLPVAALDAGCASGELHLIRAEHLVLQADGHYALAAPGTERDNTSGFTVAHPRQLQVARWATPLVTTALAEHNGKRPLLYHGASTDQVKQQSAILMNVNNLLKRAGLAADRSVQPLSIRNTAARERYDRDGNIEQVVAMLGADSYDTVLREIGLRPHPAKG